VLVNCFLSWLSLEVVRNLQIYCFAVVSELLVLLALEKNTSVVTFGCSFQSFELKNADSV